MDAHTQAVKMKLQNRRWLFMIDSPFKLASIVGSLFDQLIAGREYKRIRSGDWFHLVVSSKCKSRELIPVIPEVDPEPLAPHHVPTPRAMTARVIHCLRNSNRILFG
jgi:hypothetical protein